MALISLEGVSLGLKLVLPYRSSRALWLPHISRRGKHAERKCRQKMFHVEAVEAIATNLCDPWNESWVVAARHRVGLSSPGTNTVKLLSPLADTFTNLKSRILKVLKSCYKYH